MNVGIEDTSFLMASISEALDVDTVLLLYSDHMTVDFASSSCPGNYYNYQGRKYVSLKQRAFQIIRKGFFLYWENTLMKNHPSLK